MIVKANLLLLLLIPVFSINLLLLLSLTLRPYLRERRRSDLVEIQRPFYRRGRADCKRCAGK